MQIERRCMSDYLSVSDITKYLKLKFDRDPYLERVYLTGQVSNFRKRPSHQYFSLKDEKAVIQATMWAGAFKKLGFEFEEGMKINVVGRVQLYEPGGSYSIIIERAEPDGIGALAVQFEQLKKRLTEAGYFDAKHKQAIPKFSKKIGVITSPSGAVIRDIITTVSRRFPGVEILLFPTKVQGEGASQEIAKNISLANQESDIDVLIVGRGGGSIEDLWAFNEEIVVQAIFESHLPVISSVGHETDVTLSDFVADYRAATPTAAAEIATPITKADLLAFLQEYQSRSYQATLRHIQQRQIHLERIMQTVVFRQPERLYDSYVVKLEQLKTSLIRQMETQVTQSQQKVAFLEQGLRASDVLGRVRYNLEKVSSHEDKLKTVMTNQYRNAVKRFEKAQDTLLSLDTKRILARGYAIVKQNGHVLSEKQPIAVGESLELELKERILEVEVKHVKNNKDI